MTRSRYKVSTLFDETGLNQAFFEVVEHSS